MVGKQIFALQMQGFLLLWENILEYFYNKIQRREL